MTIKKEKKREIWQGNPFRYEKPVNLLSVICVLGTWIIVLAFLTGLLGMSGLK